jgi:hypothetical protein
MRVVFSTKHDKRRVKENQDVYNSSRESTNCLSTLGKSKEHYDSETRNGLQNDITNRSRAPRALEFNTTTFHLSRKPDSPSVALTTPL